MKAGLTKKSSALKICVAAKKKGFGITSQSRNGRNETFAIGETRFGLRSKHQRLESDRKGKRGPVTV